MVTCVSLKCSSPPPPSPVPPHLRELLAGKVSQLVFSLLSTAAVSVALLNFKNAPYHFLLDRQVANHSSRCNYHGKYKVEQQEEKLLSLLRQPEQQHSGHENGQLVEKVTPNSHSSWLSSSLIGEELRPSDKLDCVSRDEREYDVVCSQLFTAVVRLVATTSAVATVKV